MRREYGYATMNICRKNQCFQRKIPWEKSRTRHVVQEIIDKSPEFKCTFKEKLKDTELEFIGHKTIEAVHHRNTKKGDEQLKSPRNALS